MDVAVEHMEAIALTVELLADLGAVLPADKSVVLSKDPAIRAHFRTTALDGLSAPLPVKPSTKDLGAHLNCAGRARGNTLARRLEEGARVARQVATAAAPVHLKCR
eukprot:3935840-Alexandrium_andersonii.AAC.1